MTENALNVTALGQTVAIPQHPDKQVLEKVPNPHPADPYVARFTVPEFTSLCPVTGQPDFAHLMIDYVPARCFSRRVHSSDRQGFGGPSQPALAAHWRLLVSARRHSN